MAGSLVFTSVYLNPSVKRVSPRGGIEGLGGYEGVGCERGWRRGWGRGGG